MIGAETPEIERQKFEDAVGIGNRPRGLLGDDVRQVAGITLCAGERFLPVAAGQLDGDKPHRRRQQQGAEPDDRQQKFRAPAAGHDAPPAYLVPIWPGDVMAERPIPPR